MKGSLGVHGRQGKAVGSFKSCSGQEGLAWQRGPNEGVPGSPQEAGRGVGQF